MKNLFLILLVCLSGFLFGQENPECSINAGADQIINSSDLAKLQATSTGEGVTNYFWSYVGGPMGEGDVSFSDPKNFNTSVFPTPPNNNWKPGTYRFQFCAQCNASGGDAAYVQVCDEMVIEVRGGESPDGGGSEAECSANAGPDQTICYNDIMQLSAPINGDYADDAEPRWDVVAAQQTVSFSNQFDYNTDVLPGPTWNFGPYVFQFCATCKDLDGNEVGDRVCDTTIVTVMDDVTVPEINPSSATFCTEGSFDINLPGAGEFYGITVEPEDGLVEWSVSGNSLTVKRKDTNSYLQGECDYTITYSISNGGCIETTTATVHFVRPQYAQGGETVLGYILSCPSCSDTLSLYGDRPGCGQEGYWSFVSSSGGVIADTLYENPQSGDASIVVSGPGTYTFEYNVTFSPDGVCPNSSYQVTCEVFEVGGFNIGSNPDKTFCGNIVPAGSYTFNYANLPNTVYQWSSNLGNPPVEIVSPHGSSSVVNILAPIDLSITPFYIYVAAWRYYMDSDCSGPAPFELVTLPSSDPDVNFAYIQQLMHDNPNACFASCYDADVIRFVGAGTVEVDNADVNFLCSDCTEYIRVGDYFDVTNGVPYFTNITMIPPTGPPVNNIGETELVTLGACGDYQFLLDVISYNYEVVPALYCTTSVVINVRLRGPEPVSAGTPQEKCFNETIRLNGNLPFGDDIPGTWACINNATVSFSDVHDPNTQVFHNFQISDLPQTLIFVWEFESEGAECDLSDTTYVIINDCTNPCPEITVKSECKDGQMTLTAYDQTNSIVGPPYHVNWTLDAAPFTSNDNPVTFTYPGNAVNYQAYVVLFGQDEQILCEAKANGTAACARSICDVHIVEECDKDGNLVVTIVDDNTGLPVVPSFVDNLLIWYVNGSSLGYQNQNPIVIPPSACYSLDAEFYIYADGAPHWPGTWIDICHLDIPKTCPNLQCGCEEYLPGFIVAGYGDAIATSMGLQFPPNSYPVCGGFNSTWGTLGVFHLDGTPVTDFSKYSITWENGSTGTYVTGSILFIDHVTICSVKHPECVCWKTKYKRICCDVPPTWVHCENPIVKHCDGTNPPTYTPQPTQIVWTGVPGATGYEMEITHGVSSECCSDPLAPSVETYIVPAVPIQWVIPPGYTCFSVRIKPIFSSELCKEAVWSDVYEYCASEANCERVIVVCGCCGGAGKPTGDRQEDGLRTVVVSEEEINAMLNANRGPSYLTLADAIGRTDTNEPSFSIFPNPANELLEIKPSGLKTGNYGVVLQDMLGRELQRATFSGNASKQIDVSRLPQGFYTIAIKDVAGQTIHSEKISILR